MADGWEEQRLENFTSRYLKRPVRIDVFLPPDHYRTPEKYPVLVMNDGQDMEAVQMKKHLERALRLNQICPLIVVAVHAGDRMQEYGTIDRPDYQKRGARAKAYSRFITEELIPLLKRRFHCRDGSAHWAIAGFSLGGLSAFDLAWHYPQYFGKAGVFSGSFWWRSKSFKPEDPDADRIMHEVVRRGPRREGQQYWFQTGAHDETDDRNNNGIIDSIDDTLDLIAELEKLGSRRGSDIQYLEVVGGEHNHRTWARVMPKFLMWLFTAGS